MRLRWTLQAADDLAAIKEFIERDSATYARQVIERIYDAAAELGAFPDVGRAVPEREQENIREILRPPYRIIYRRAVDIIEILTIHHSSRVLPKEFGRGAV
jgi:plasmid stabilization system protein ParE